jgi:hypothetical protein
VAYFNVLLQLSTVMTGYFVKILCSNLNTVEALYHSTNLTDMSISFLNSDIPIQN